MYSPVCVRPVQKPHCWFSHEAAHFILLLVINELDGLAQGSKTGQYDSEEHARKVKHRAKTTIDYLEQEFEKKNSHLKAQTSKGSVLETIAFRVEETDKTVSTL